MVNIRIAAGVVVLLSCLPAVGRAECSGFPGKSMLAQPSVVVAFSGTVQEVRPVGSVWPGQVVVFHVDRVWKGKVGKVFTLYNAKHPIEGISFEPRMEYIVFAHHLTERERQNVDLPATGPPVVGVGQCGDGSILRSKVPPHEDLGAGAPPE